MVRLVDESGAPCALHLAVRDASGEPILELRADSPEWWDFGAVTVLHTPDGRFCGSQMPTATDAMRQLECYYPTASSPTARFEQLEAYVAPHTSPRYIIARPLAGGPQEEWHASQLESVSERIPKLYRAFKEAGEPQREELRSLIERVMQEEQLRSTVPIEVKFADLVPGAVWSEVARGPL